MVARGCRVQREARGPVVEVSRGRRFRVCGSQAGRDAQNCQWIYCFAPGWLMGVRLPCGSNDRHTQRPGRANVPVVRSRQSRCSTAKYSKRAAQGSGPDGGGRAGRSSREGSRNPSITSDIFSLPWPPVNYAVLDSSRERWTLPCPEHGKVHIGEVEVFGHARSDGGLLARRLR